MRSWCLNSCQFFTSTLQQDVKQVVHLLTVHPVVLVTQKNMFRNTFLWKFVQDCRLISIKLHKIVDVSEI